MESGGFDLGILWQQLATWKNLIIVVACGGVMEAFKRGPGTSKFAATRAGQVLQYYAPVGWCWAALFIPWGLSPSGASIGEKTMLGIVLGTVTSSVYEWTVKAFKKLVESSKPSAPSLALPGEEPKS